VSLCAWRLPLPLPLELICLPERRAWFRTLRSPQRSPRFQVALVTGGGSGIGLEITRQLAAHGARVAICGRRANVVADSVALLRGEGLQVEGTHADVRSPVRLRSQQRLGMALTKRCSCRRMLSDWWPSRATRWAASTSWSTVRRGTSWRCQRVRQQHSTCFLHMLTRLHTHSPPLRRPVHQRVQDGDGH